MAERDPGGYYQALGVAPDAKASEITAAYRRLAKELHPDKNPGAGAKERFQKVAEAYGVVGNPERRAAYDTSPPPSSSEAEGPRTIDPVVCHKCKTVVAQPRYIIFRSVVSLILATITTPIQGIYCSRCASREAFRASAVSAVAGWWGFPWGPIRTIAEISRNAFGGERPAGSEQRLLWLNALAFWTRGNLLLAHGLARRVQALDQNELAAHASDLVSELHRNGVPRDAPSLKNPWARDYKSIFLHFAMLFALPAAFVVLVSSATNAPATGYVTSGPPASSTAGVLTPDPTVSGGGAPAPQCVTPPANGQILGGETPESNPGHQLEIQNGSDGPVIVKARYAGSGRLAFSFFVAQGAAATVSGIPDGSYRFQYAIGTIVLPDCRDLGGIQSVEEFPDVENLTTTYTATQVETQTLSYTLYTVPGGNVQPQSISASDFDAG